MHEAWIEGTANATYQIRAEGLSPSEFWQSAEGTIEAEMREGALPHIFLAHDSGPLRIERLEGRAHLHDGKVEIEDARLNSKEGMYSVSGSVFLNREIDLKLARSPFVSPLGGVTRGYLITGTLTQPHVSPVPGAETQAQLKVK
jgi:hypothetical protein